MLEKEEAPSVLPIPEGSPATKVGSVITGLWLIFMVVMIVFNWDKAKLLALNEWGDVFAGFFAPLAFLWLVLGFIQQGTELRLSSRALQIQAAELTQSVRQQREMVRVAEQAHAAELAKLKREQKRELAELEPLFVFSCPGPRGRTSTGGIWVPVNIRNAGGTVTNLEFVWEREFGAPMPQERSALEKGDDFKFNVPIEDDDQGFIFSIKFLDAGLRLGSHRFAGTVVRTSIVFEISIRFERMAPLITGYVPAVE